MKTMIVTGAAGFIGTNFVRLVLESDESRVVVLDKLSYAGNLCTIEPILNNPRFIFIEADIANREEVEAAFRLYNPDALINFAAETHVDRSIDDPTPFIESNTVGTFQLLETSRKHLEKMDYQTRERFRFLQVSTDEVYGTLGETGLFSETTPYAPNSPYSASKAGADFFVRAWYETYGLPVLITNCSNNYGPYQYPEKLISLSILNLIEGKPISIYGDGGNVRDWLYVEDHCTGIMEVLRKGRLGEKYNIGGKNERTNLQIIDAIISVLEEMAPATENYTLKKKGIKRYEELKTFVDDRPGHDRRYAIDATKISVELGWKPKYSFEEGLRRTVRWYLDNRSWCEKVLKDKYDKERIGLKR